MKTSLHRSLALNLIGALAVTAMTAGAAAIYPKQQDRSVQVSLDIAGVPNFSSASASGFGAFSNSVAFSGGGWYEPYNVQATQDSQIGASNMTASGSAVVGLANALVGNANAQSDFKVKFRLLQPVTFSLAGQLIWNEIGTLVVESPWVRLSGASGVIFQTDAATMDATPLDYSATADLLPGEYVLEAHAGVTNDFANGAEKSFTLDFSVTPTGRAVPGFGKVYQLLGSLAGTELKAGKFAPVLILPHNLVNLAQGLSSTTSPYGQVLALVSDTLDHTVRLAVWDKKTGAVTLELGPVDFEAQLNDGTKYVATAVWVPGNIGRIANSPGAAMSRLTMAASGTLDVSGTVNGLIALPTIGQLSLINEAGTTNTVILRAGSFATGYKLGTTP
jgi:hypothetical protein